MVQPTLPCIRILSVSEALEVTKEVFGAHEGELERLKGVIEVSEGGLEGLEGGLEGLKGVMEGPEGVLEGLKDVFGLEGVLEVAA